MSLLIKNGEVYYHNRFSKQDVLVDDEGRLLIADTIDLTQDEVDEIIDASSVCVIPGLIDPHVHLREPGFEYKETIETGTLSATSGGYTTVFAMPNLNPVADSVEHLALQQERIHYHSKIQVYPYATITVGQKGQQLSDIEALSKEVLAFSDDGKGVQNQDMMKEAMRRCKACDRLIVAHCEDESLLVPGGCMHDGKRAKQLGCIGISSASEYKQIERDLQLAKETGCQYHVCHISCKESVELIRQAKKQGVDVSCEVTVHHLLLNEEDISENDGRFKMNPPLRSKEDQQALLEGLQDGTIDMICTDHAPHSIEEKSRGLENSAMGIIGSQFAFSLIYTHLVKTKKISLEKLIECMSYNCANLFGIEGGELINFEKANLTLVDLNHGYKITEKSILSKGKSTPFLNSHVHGVVLMTICDGNIVTRRDI